MTAKAVQLFRLTGLKLLLLLLILLPGLPVHAQPGIEILILKSSDSELYSELSELLQQQIPVNCASACNKPHSLRFRVETADDFANNAGNPATLPELTITLGLQAKNLFDAIPGAGNHSVIHAMLPNKPALQQLKPQHSALVLDQPPLQILRITAQLIKSDKPVGMLYSPESRWQLDAISAAASELGLAIKLIGVTNTDITAMGSQLADNIGELAAVVIIPDKTIYNRSTIGQILLTGFLNRTPFIGYSRALAKTGALASVVTDIEDIPSDIAVLAVDILNKKPVERIHFPKRYRLVVNASITEAMGFDINEVERLPHSEVINR